MQVIEIYITANPKQISFMSGATHFISHYTFHNLDLKTTKPILTVNHIT